MNNLNLSDDTANFILKGAREVMPSMKDTSLFLEKKAGILMAVTLSIAGYFLSNPPFNAATSTGASMAAFALMAIMLVIAFLSLIYALLPRKYYDVFFDIRKILSQDDAFLQNEQILTKMLIPWYQDAIKHNRNMNNKKAQAIKAAIYALTIAALIYFALSLYSHAQ